MFKHGKHLALVDRHEAVVMRCWLLRSVKPAMSLDNEGRNRENRNGALSARRVE